MLRALPLSLLLLAATASARAQVPVATVSGFTALQVSTTDPKGLTAAWDQPTPGARLQVQHQTVRGKPISTFINFKGCRVDSAGVCDVVARMTLVKPDGAPMGPDMTLVVWPRRPPVPAGNFALSPQAFTVNFDAGDALGTYRLQSDVMDRVAGVTVHLDGPIVLAGG